MKSSVCLTSNSSLRLLHVKVQMSLPHCAVHCIVVDVLPVQTPAGELLAFLNTLRSTSPQQPAQLLDTNIHNSLIIDAIRRM
jgi:hypothetical protein